MGTDAHRMAAVVAGMVIQSTPVSFGAVARWVLPAIRWPRRGAYPFGPLRPTPWRASLLSPSPVPPARSLRLPVPDVAGHP